MRVNFVKKKLVILGAGCGGTMIANMLRKKLAVSEWSITIIDKDNKHIYQPGLLFIPVGVYKPEEIVRTRSEFIGKDINFVVDEIKKVDAKEQVVETTRGSYEYDKIIVSTGVNIDIDEIDGLREGMYNDIFDFYTMEGAKKLAEAYTKFRKGKIILVISELPFKCPVAPLEFVFLSDWYFTEKGVRDQIEIELVTPIQSAFTKPKASAYFTEIANEKNIKITPNFEIESVDHKAKVIKDPMDNELSYDLMAIIPPNRGAKYLVDSGIAIDESGIMNTDKHTMKSVNHDNMWILGDNANIPTSKAGAVAHFSAEILVENFLREINGEEIRPDYDGHANCFIETGFGKAALIDFNYEYEPLPGKFPLPGVGPFTLLGESKANHWGKMMFKWVYWNKLMRGEELPLEAQMSLAGKHVD